MANDKSKTGVFAPNYYSEFRCIADRCRHSCCIDWEICIDDRTLEKYRKMQDIMDTISLCEDGACFALAENGRCPHLNEAGLCRIILSHGEEYLSDICQNHPRFFNEVGMGRTEAGLGLVCEEACRLILESEKPFALTQTEMPDAFFDIEDDEDAPLSFDPLPQRERIFAIIQAPETRLDETLAALTKSFSLPEIPAPAMWLDRFLSLEILDADWERILQAAKENSACRNPAQDGQYEKYHARLLTYFVYRHVSIAQSEDDLRARLAFCVLSVEMIRFLFQKEAEQTKEALIELARRYSAEIEYSEDNTFELIFELERRLPVES